MATKKVVLYFILKHQCQEVESKRAVEGIHRRLRNDHRRRAGQCVMLFLLLANLTLTTTGAPRTMWMWERCIFLVLLLLLHDSCNCLVAYNICVCHSSIYLLSVMGKDCTGYVWFMWLIGKLLHEQTKLLYLCDQLRPEIEQQNTQLRRVISTEYTVAVILWCLATPIGYRTIAHLFGIAAMFMTHVMLLWQRWWKGTSTSQLVIKYKRS